MQGVADSQNRHHHREADMLRFIVLANIALAANFAAANEPVAMYIFPAGGQRGTTVDVRVGGLFFHGECSFQMTGPGVEASPRIRETSTVWFEGPVIPLPDSQRAEDYPKDHAGKIAIAADAALGVRHWRVATSQGITPAKVFIVGDLPEFVEEEIDGEPIPVPVKLPVTINGRIFPREDVDSWSLDLQAGQTINCEVNAARLGSPLDARLEVLDPHGRRLAENDEHYGADPFIRFTAPANGTYQVRIHDIAFEGLQPYVYRLTLTSGPYVSAVYPLGGRRGSEVLLEWEDAARNVLRTDTGADARGTSSALRAKLAIPADAPAAFATQLSVEGQSTNSFLLDTDDLAEHLESEPNNSADKAAQITLPGIANGRIDTPGDIDVWSFSAAKGDVWELDLRASRLSSPLDSVLVVLDAAGKELARSDDLSGEQSDSQLRFTAPSDGVYSARVEERFSSRGGPEFSYRLRIDRAAAPSFRLMLASDAVNVPRGGEARLKLDLERLGGFAEAVNLTFEGLPEGVSANPASIAAKQNNVQVAFKADAAARIQAARIIIRGTAEIGGSQVSRQAMRATSRGEPEIDHLMLAVAMPTPFKVVGVYNSCYAPRGSVHRRSFRIERNGFQGPLEVSLADRQARHLQGVTGPKIIVPPEASEFEYPAFLAPWLEIGRTSRTCLMAVGVVKDADGSEHRVSFSSVNQNEQIVILTDPGLLSVQLERSSLAALPGQSVELPLRVDRGRGVQSPVTIELIVPPHVRGIAAEPLALGMGDGQGSLRIRFEADPGPLNMPLVVRATATNGNDPIVAETHLEIAPPQR
jgi:hypothetical protein